MPLDIGLGIFASILISKIFGVGLSTTLLIFGIVSSLLLDLDFIIFKFKANHKNEDDARHRDLLHYPIFFLIVGLIITLFSKSFGTLFLVGTLGHLLHDSVGLGWGIQWLYPFNKNYFTFFYRYQPRDREQFQKKWFYNDTPEEQRALAEKYGIKDWMQEIYLRMHPYAIVEFLVFIAAVIALLYVKIKS
ncbi:MAG TPA: metal-dependent hydrolase [Patescibacteria group bacterium]|nr:metal-dependent hydrolase [Patescibacteria group bacterium]